MSNASYVYIFLLQLQDSKVGLNNDDTPTAVSFCGTFFSLFPPLFLVGSLQHTQRRGFHLFIDSLLGFKWSPGFLENIC